MIVVTVVSDDLTTPIVVDSLGTAFSAAVHADSTACDSGSGMCRAIIFTGVASTLSGDSVTVADLGSKGNLRIQAWEFSGVNSVAGVASCNPVCPATSYPSPSVLLATGRDVTGAGAGFTWYAYAGSGPVGSEYQIIGGGQAPSRSPSSATSTSPSSATRHSTSTQPSPRSYTTVSAVFSNPIAALLLWATIYPPDNPKGASPCYCSHHNQRERVFSSLYAPACRSS